MNNAVIVVAAVLALAACADVSSVPAHTAQEALPGAGVTYSLPRGMVPIRVFADAQGIAISVEPSYSVADPEAPSLVAQLKPSVLNRETMSVETDANGLLSLISSDSQAKILEIAAEAGKAFGRITFQSGKATALATSVTVLQRDLDPLSIASLASINAGIEAAVGRAAGAYAGATGKAQGAQPLVSLAVDPPPQAESPVDLGKCRVGICVRVMTSRTITVLLNGQAFASKVVTVPSWRIVPVSIPQSILSDQKVTVTIKEGMLTKYELTRDSEALGLVKIPGAILGGVVSGVTQGINDRKAIVETQTGLVKSQTTLAEAREAAEKQAMAGATGGLVKTQAGTAGAATTTTGTAGSAMVTGTPGAAVVTGTPSTATTPASNPNLAAYKTATLTVYPFSTALQDAIVAIRNPPRNPGDR